MNSDLKPTKLTKVLIHKTHGGRKKDSKFWKDDIYLDKKTDIDIPIEKTKKKRLRKYQSPWMIPPGIILLVVVVLVLARPDLFPFLEYHKVYKTIEKIDNIASTTPYENTKQPNPPETYHSRNPVIPVRYKDTEPSNKKPKTQGYKQNSINNITSNVSLKGLVFSWLDKEGKRHFSNTNYPINNPSLQVQTEINTYRKVTKIHVKDNQIYVPVTLKNDGRSTTTWMVLDTGCSHTNVPYSVLNKINARYGNVVYSTIADGSRKKNREAFIDSIQVGSQREKNVRVTGSKIAGSSNTGLLGLDFLKQRPFKVDTERQMLVWM